MAIADDKKQKHLIQNILASPEVYTRCASILKPEYFRNEILSRAVKFIHEYYEKYNATPSISQLDAEFDDLEMEGYDKIPRDQVEYTCDEIEKFCKEVAIHDAIMDSLEDIEKHEMSKVLARITDAVNISLQKDMGIEVFEDPEERLKSLIEAYTPIPTGIEGIDSPLNGGLVRTQFTLVSANSGGGKSVMLSNFGVNFCLQGLNTVCLSLELDEGMVFLRTASILTGYDASNWKAHIPEISTGIIAADGPNTGSFIIKRLPQGSTAADIRSYLSYYEMEYERQPDVIIIDYLDLMHPNGGVKNIGVFEQDKQKTEEVVEILHDYNAIGISASQQNREALTSNQPSQAGIAGGISKVNTVDNYISLIMTDTMRLEGTMHAAFLKTRSSRGVGHMSVLDFDPSSLRITDPKDGGQISVMPKKRKDDQTPSIEEMMEEVNPTRVTAEIEGLPGIEEEVEVKEPPAELFEDDGTNELPLMPKLKSGDGGESLLKLMDDLRGDNL